MTTPMTDSGRQAQIRLGAASAILGALLALVGNVLHPDLPADPAAVLTMVATSPTWGLLHVSIMASVVLLVGGLAGLSQVADEPLPRALARLGLVVALPGAAVMLVGMAIDGFAGKALADQWAGATGADSAALFPVAVAVESVQTALFHTWAALFVGAPFLLLGVSGLMPGGGFPRGLGIIAVVGGGGALYAGVIGYLHAPSGLLFTVSALLVTLWALIASVIAWRRTGRSAVAPAAAPVAATLTTGELS
ncbi:MAG: hypothetical protein IT340_21690 [Chloroflexi bacterium]|nr:hypothetical protein [Chloroflexota bacterium]